KLIIFCQSCVSVNPVEQLLGFFILVGVIASLLLLRWQRSNQSYLYLTEEQMDYMLSASIDEMLDSQTNEMNNAINEKLEPIESDISSIRGQLQGAGTDSSLKGDLSTPNLDINRLSYDFFLLVRWGVTFGVVAIFGLRILTVILGYLRTFLDTLLDNYRIEQQTNLRQREQRLAEREQRQNRE
ncbi:MAG: hypothetical protein ACTS2F_29740, partial [Thainema sp.]